MTAAGRGLRSCYVGIPYLDRGQDPLIGLDCWGLVRLFYACEFCIGLPPIDQTWESGHSRAEVGQAVTAEAAARWRAVETPEHGDVAILKLAEMPFHCGIVLDGALLLHSLNAGQASVIEPLRGLRWGRRIEGFYRHADRAPTRCLAQQAGAGGARSARSRTHLTELGHRVASR